MEKSKIKITPSVNTVEVIRFINQNSEYDWNESNDIFAKELDHILYELPNQIEMVDEFRIFKVIIGELSYDGWIKKFTEIYADELTEDYYILFTN